METPLLPFGGCPCPVGPPWGSFSLPLPPGEPPAPLWVVPLPCRTPVETPNHCPIGITALPMAGGGGVPTPHRVPLPHGTPIPSQPPPNSRVCPLPRLLLLLPRQLQQLRQGLCLQGAGQQQVQLLPLSCSPVPVHSQHASGMGMGGGGGHKKAYFFMFLYLLYQW